MDNLEIAKALFGNSGGSGTGSKSGGQTTTAYGIATSDSADGIVRVNLGGETVSQDDDQTLDVETTFAVFEGDKVIVSLIGADGTGKAPVVIGVVGRGDEQQREINSVMNYFWTDQYGAHVSTKEHSVEDANVLLDSDSLDIRFGNSNDENDQTVYASFGREVTVGSRYSGSAVGDYSQVFGYQCQATNDYAHAEGYQTQAKGKYSHAEGAGTHALADYSHTEGDSTEALSWGAHAEGNSTSASGLASHAEGHHTEAPGSYSHAEGLYTKANGAYQHVQGKYNKTTGTNADIIGNGTADDARSNAYNMDWNGNAEFQGEVYVGGCTPNGETPYPVVRYNTGNSKQEYYDKANSTWAQVPGGGGGSWTSLWTNNNPTSNFVAQNVNVDITNYSVFIVQYRQSTTSDVRVSVFVVKNDVNHIVQNIGVIISSGNVTLSARNVKTNGNTGFTFEGAYRKNATSTSAGALTNSQLIPVAIYGVC